MPEGVAWIERAAKELEGRNLIDGEIRRIIAKHLPQFPLLQCVDCRNTESPAGAMARQFNHGRCLHCGGFFKVIRA